MDASYMASMLVLIHTCAIINASKTLKFVASAKPFTPLQHLQQLLPLSSPPLKDVQTLKKEEKKDERGGDSKDGGKTDASSSSSSSKRDRRCSKKKIAITPPPPLAYAAACMFYVFFGILYVYVDTRDAHHSSPGRVNNRDKPLPTGK
jgi:hypothetical protein